ncbi:MAG: hypothetical protein ACLFQV_04240, partial [Vulcanimicrobiota bacterium]
MKINPHVQIRNMQQVGGQRNQVRKRDLKNNKDATDIQNDDHISLSDQAKMGQKVGESTGMAGRKGSKKTKKDDKARKHKTGMDRVELGHEEERQTQETGRDNTFQASRERVETSFKEMQKTGSRFTEVLQGASPDEKKVLGGLQQQVEQFAQNHEQQTGQKVDRTALF